MYQILKDGSRFDPGNWRIEVSPREQRKFDTFLHLLYPCDRDEAVPQRAKGIESDNGLLTGVFIDMRIVLFGTKGPLQSNVTYTVKKSGKVANLLLDLEKSKTYKFSIHYARGSSRKMEMKSSKDGTLFFYTNGLCRIELK